MKKLYPALVNQLAIIFPEYARHFQSLTFSVPTPAELFVDYTCNDGDVIKVLVNIPQPTQNFRIWGLDATHAAAIEKVLQSTPNKKASAFFTKFYNLIKIRNAHKPISSNAGKYYDGAISFDVDADASDYNYRTFFHEGAHNIDDRVLFKNYVYQYPGKASAIRHGITHLNKKFASAIAQDGARLEDFYKARGVTAVFAALRHDFEPLDGLGYNLPLMALKSLKSPRRIKVEEFFAELMSHAIAAPDWYAKNKAALPRTTACFEELLDTFNPEGAALANVGVDADKVLADFFDASRKSAAVEEAEKAAVESQYTRFQPGGVYKVRKDCFASEPYTGGYVTIISVGKNFVNAMLPGGAIEVFTTRIFRGVERFICGMYRRVDAVDLDHIDKPLTFAPASSPAPKKTPKFEVGKIYTGYHPGSAPRSFKVVSITPSYSVKRKNARFITFELIGDPVIEDQSILCSTAHIITDCNGAKSEFVSNGFCTGCDYYHFTIYATEIC